MIVIVDYGMGNLRSVQKAFERIGQQAEVTDRPERVAAAERIVVPGVGAFGDAMAALRSHGLVEPIRDFVAAGRPALGICLGLHVLFEESEEVAEAPVEVAAMAGQPLPKGLALLPGRVQHFGPEVVRQGLKVPHMGWNVVRPVGPSPLFDAMPREGVYFYFAHSYYAAPRDRDVVVGETDYGLPFASAVRCGNLHATQFHPEKSQAAGLALLERFVTCT
ncbi:MAG: imidazole glycerol phosphate synthase subunit HisH [Planctomycetes bacterium]|nr:imidazole glycerol phosphate synthase subunit HisH [Planctomycetota bacterium]